MYEGVEHVGLYPTSDASAKEIVDWYAETFDFEATEGNSSYFLSSDGPGRLEIMKSEPDHPCHIAILVSDFEAALEDLDAKGIEYEEPSIKPAVKAVYLKEPDPAGNTVHLLWLG
ncbi:MAG: VOC family protein [Anaerolineales bacterium]